jgi:hypothetical protein
MTRCNSTAAQCATRTAPVLRFWATSAASKSRRAFTPSSCFTNSCLRSHKDGRDEGLKNSPFDVPGRNGAAGSAGRGGGMHASTYCSAEHLRGCLRRPSR